jgi:2-methylcitrate dehydratase PrpD
MVDGTAALAEFAASVRCQGLPQQLRTRLSWLTADNVAAGWIGSRQPWYRKVLAVTQRLGGTAQCPAFGTAELFDPARASLLGGTAIGGFEAAHGTAGAQQGAAVFPAVLALATARNAAGADLLAAMAAGYEVNARVAAAQTNRTETGRGFHNPAVSGVFGAAAGCGRLLGLSAARMEHALGIAGSSAAGLIAFVWEGAETKRMHLGRAAQLGLEAALLADGGISGPAGVLECEYGYLHAYSPEPKPTELTAGLGTSWLTEEIFVKPYPTHGTSQAIVAIMDQWHQAGGDPHEVTDVALSVAADAAEPRHADRAPGTVLGAQYSVPFTAAVAVRYGADGVRGLDAQMLEDPAVTDLAVRLSVCSDPRFGRRALRGGAEATLTTAAGQQKLVGPGLGPVSPKELAGLCAANVRAYGRGHVSNALEAQLLTAIPQLEFWPDLTLLAAATTGDGGSAPVPPAAHLVPEERRVHP